MPDPVTVLVGVASNPAFVRLQHRLLARFCQDDHRLLVVNDAVPAPHFSNGGDGTTCAAIERTCADLGIACLRMPQAIHADRGSLYAAPLSTREEPASRTADTLDWALKHHALPRRGRLAILDADMFPVVPFSFSELLDGHALSGVPQMRRGRSWFRTRTVRYLWNGLLYLDVDVMPDPETFELDSGRIHGVPCDVGARTHDYLVAHPALRVRPIRHRESGTWRAEEEPWLPPAVVSFLREDPKNPPGGHYAEVYDRTFLHYRAGSNWTQDGPALLDGRRARFLEALDRLG